MTLVHILAFSVIAVAASLIAKGRWRSWMVLVASVAALFWLQPLSPIRYLDFWLPLVTLALTLLVWLVVRSPKEAASTQDSELKPPAADTPDTRRGFLVTIAIVLAVVLIIGALRYVEPLCCLTASRPPQLWIVALAILAIGVVGAVFARALPGERWKTVFFIVLLIILLVVLKTEPLAQAASAGLRSLMGQSSEHAAALDIRWLGVSYIFFRLIHTLRDRQTGVLPALSLREFVNYVLFFPTLTAGPIDRADRFIKDAAQPFRLSLNDAFEGAERIVVGIFKKFVLADTLALFALNDVNATQAHSALWLWVMLYAYAFRIYFDFAGYSDIAIGLGRLLGFRIPENFDRPYLKTNLTAFWNSWHITLAMWFRAYFFNPLSRAMRSGRYAIPAAVIIAASQLSTMVLIGMWHGITWNFVIWGAWHGVGLFIHNRFADLTRASQRRLNEKPRLRAAVDVARVVLTFHYVTLGWVWFALPDVGLSWNVMLNLFGL